MKSFFLVALCALMAGNAIADDVVTAKPNLLLQGWATDNANNTSKDQTFRLRRSEIKFTGQVNSTGFASDPRYFFMIDPAKLIVPPGGSSIKTETMIQDFGFKYSVLPELELTAGQFKIPTTAEGLDSSGDLPLPERSLVGRTLGDKREMGLMAAYKRSTWNTAAMLSSGRPVSTPGSGMAHDLILRAEATPIKALGLGAFGVLGNDFSYTSKGRWGVNARGTYESLGLRVEYSHANDGAVNYQGITNEASYWFTSDFQSVTRFETYTPNTSGAFTGYAETVGFNYYLRRQYTKLQLAGTDMQNLSAVNGSPSFTKNVDNQDVTLVLQFSI